MPLLPRPHARDRRDRAARDRRGDPRLARTRESRAASRQGPSSRALLRPRLRARRPGRRLHRAALPLTPPRDPRSPSALPNRRPRLAASALPVAQPGRLNPPAQSPITASGARFRADDECYRTPLAGTSGLESALSFLSSRTASVEWPAEQIRDLLIRDVAVVHVDTGTREPNRDVLVRDGRIAAIEPAGSVQAGLLRLGAA